MQIVSNGDNLHEMSNPDLWENKKNPSKHVYMGPIWAESGHLSHSGPAWAPYRLFCPYKTYIGPILVNFDQQTRIYGNHMGRFGAFIPFGSYLGPI